MEYLRKLIKISKLIIIFLFISCFLTGSVCAEEMQSEELPEELPEEPQKCEKPDVCGEIIFDPTVQEIPISLEEAISIVLDKNFDVKIFVQRKLRDKWLTYLAASEFLPDIAADFRVEALRGVFLAGEILPEEINSTPYRIRTFFVYDINARNWFALKEAYYNFKSAGQELEFTRDEALLEASRRYFELLRTKLQIEIHEIHVKQIEEQFTINLQRVAAGTGTRFDVLRAEADRDNAVQELLRARNAYRLAQAQLANVLGIPVFFQLVPCEKDILLKEIFCDCFDLQRACEMALGFRNDLASQIYDIQAAKQRKNLAYSLYLPEVRFFGQVAGVGTTRLNGVFGNRSVGMEVLWAPLENLGLRGYTEAKVREAEIREQQLIYANRTRDIQENLVRSFSDFITARELIESTTRELEAASASRELSLIRLQEELGSFLDVIQAQSVYTRARLDRLDAVTEYNITQIELLFEMGVISVENILYGFNSGTLKPNTNYEKAREYNKKIMEELERLKKDEESRNQQSQQKQGTLRQLPGEQGLLPDQEPGSGSDIIRQGESGWSSDNQSGQSSQIRD